MNELSARGFDDISCPFDESVEPYVQVIWVKNPPEMRASFIQIHGE